MHKATPRTLRKAFRKLPKPCETQPTIVGGLPKPYGNLPTIVGTSPKPCGNLPTIVGCILKPCGTSPTIVGNAGGPAEPMQTPVFPGIFRKFR